MKTFSVSGTFKMGGKKIQPFKKEVQAKNKELAKEITYSLIGSKHACPRRFISIKKVEEKNE